MNIVLVGFMGVGKTTVGKILAKELKWKFYDCDNLIIQKTELSIDDIFKLYGEAKFRVVESEILSKLLKLERVIIATGGGVITRYKNVELIKKRGIVIYLLADVLTLCERIKKDVTKRPLLYKGNYFHEIMKLISIRENLYKEVSDIVIDTANRLPEEVVKEIVMKLKKKKII